MSIDHSYRPTPSPFMDLPAYIGDGMSAMSVVGDLDERNQRRANNTRKRSRDERDGKSNEDEESRMDEDDDDDGEEEESDFSPKRGKHKRRRRLRGGGGGDEELSATANMVSIHGSNAPGGQRQENSNRKKRHRIPSFDAHSSSSSSHPYEQHKHPRYHQDRDADADDRRRRRQDQDSLRDQLDMDDEHMSASPLPGRFRIDLTAEQQQLQQQQLQSSTDTGRCMNSLQVQQQEYVRRQNFRHQQIQFERQLLANQRAQDDYQAFNVMLRDAHLQAQQRSTSSPSSSSSVAARGGDTANDFQRSASSSMFPFSHPSRPSPQQRWHETIIYKYVDQFQFISILVGQRECITWIMGYILQWWALFFLIVKRQQANTRIYGPFWCASPARERCWRGCLSGGPQGYIIRLVCVCVCVRIIHFSLFLTCQWWWWWWW